MDVPIPTPVPVPPPPEPELGPELGPGPELELAAGVAPNANCEKCCVCTITSHALLFPTVGEAESYCNWVCSPAISRRIIYKYFRCRTCISI